jgi:DNA-binding response OmpR family regulator
VSPTLRVLVVDDDPWSQQVVSSQLMESGFRVDCAADGWEALILAGRARPDLVLLEVHLPTSDAWTVAEQLRCQQAMADVPIIFMADESPGLRTGRSFRPKTDQLVTKPFSLLQLHEAVRKALGNAIRGAAYTGSTKIIVEVPSAAHPIAPLSRELPPSESWEMEGLQPALRGSVASFGLSSLLMVIELERMSGLVTLQGPLGTGRLAIREGHVLRARVDGNQITLGAHAIYEMLQWAKGTFEFEAGEVTGEDQIERSTSFLLMEGARLADERAYAVKKS